MKKLVILLSVISIILSVIISSITIYDRFKHKESKDGAEPLPTMAAERDAALADSGNEKLEISTTNGTWYHIHLALKGERFYLHDYDPTMLEHPQVALPAEFDATIIFDFPGVVYEGKSVFVSGVCRVANNTSGVVWNYNVVFLDDVSINIREEYYNFFKSDSAKFAPVNLTWYHNGIGWRCYKTISDLNYYPEVTFSEDPRPEGWNDPNSPNFELGDNGGLDTTSLYVSKFPFIKRFYDWFCRTFNVHPDFNNFVIITLVAAGALLAIILIIVLRQAIRR